MSTGQQPKGSNNSKGAQYSRALRSQGFEVPKGQEFPGPSGYSMVIHAAGAMPRASSGSSSST